MKICNVPLKEGRLTFNQSENTPTEAKRKAALILNKMFKYHNIIKTVDEFNYITVNGTYVFIRRNIIYPSGHVTFGKFK